MTTGIDTANRGIRIKAGGAMLLVLAAATVLASSSPAALVGPKPTITGGAVVGGTLTSSDADLYKWQRCDPTTSSCDPAPQSNTHWSDIIAGADAHSYVVTAADIGHLIRVRTKGTSLGEQWNASDPVGPIPAPPQGAPGAGAGAAPAPAPEHGVRVVGEPVSGTVEVKTPGGRFQPLTGPSELPVGTIFDTRGSRVRLTAAVGAFGGTVADQPVEFYAGLFKIKQPARSNSTATAKLVEKLACGAGGPSATRASGQGPTAVTARKRSRKLWGSGSGGYATSGSGSTGSVRGTIWLTKDTCNGTLTKVVEGLGVDVFDRHLKKNFFLGPGDKHFAKR